MMWLKDVTQRCDSRSQDVTQGFIKDAFKSVFNNHYDYMIHTNVFNILEMYK